MRSEEEEEKEEKKKEEEKKKKKKVFSLQCLIMMWVMTPCSLVFFTERNIKY